jgi:dihydrolipoamide dehydrogenase
MPWVRDRIMDYTAVPGAIFTMPEVACVGLTEDQARDKGMRCPHGYGSVSASIGKAQVIGELAGQAGHRRRER